MVSNHRSNQVFSPAFVIAVGLLVVALFGLRIITSAWEWAFHKESVPLQRELNTIPRQIGPYQLIRSEVMPESVERQIGTDKYISYLYRDSRAPVGLPGSAVSLHVVYYTGNQEPVSAAHVPEICYAGSGFTRVDVRQTELEVPFRSARELDDGRIETMIQDGTMISLPGDRIPVREFEFLAPGASDTGTVLYFFFYNGRYVASRSEIAFQFLDRSSRAVYYCKVEIAPGTLIQNSLAGGGVSFVPGTDDTEDTRRLAVEFMSWMLPEIKACLPDDLIFLGGGEEGGNDAAEKQGVTLVE